MSLRISSVSSAGRPPGGGSLPVRGSRQQASGEIWAYFSLNKIGKCAMCKVPTPNLCVGHGGHRNQPTDESNN